MILETGYVYHIKNEYFDFVNDYKLMKIMKMAVQDLHTFV